MMRLSQLSTIYIACSAFILLPSLSRKAPAQSLPQPPAAYEPDPAYSGKLSYDPSTCSRDPQGMIFFAVGRRVLRQPLDNLTYMAGLNAAGRRAMPHTLHPEEPEGCPDHPVQMAAYDIRRISPMPGDAPNAASADANRIILIINGGDSPFRQNSLFELMCRMHKLRD